jgi:hypothetical protein
MPTSQNGWAASASKRDIGVQPFSVIGVEFPGGVRAGDVATLFSYLVRRFHYEVEPLHPGWCWGWAYRDVRGGTNLSNHASGTAVDINAPAHPLGTKTFSQSQRATIREIVSTCMGAVRWGGEYSGRVDEMHFEIVVSPTRLFQIMQAMPPQTGDDMSAAGEAVLLERTKQLIDIFDDYYAAKKAKYGEPVAMRHGAGRALFDLEEVIGAFYGAAVTARGREWADANPFGKAMFQLYDSLTEK